MYSLGIDPGYAKDKKSTAYFLLQQKKNLPIIISHGRLDSVDILVILDLIGEILPQMKNKKRCQWWVEDQWLGRNFKVASKLIEQRVHWQAAALVAGYQCTTVHPQTWRSTIWPGEKHTGKWKKAAITRAQQDCDWITNHNDAEAYLIALHGSKEMNDEIKKPKTKKPKTKKLC